jgi:hypothetical protein
MSKHTIGSFRVFADYLNFKKGRKQDFNLDIEIGVTTFDVDVSDKKKILFSLSFAPTNKAKKNGYNSKKFEYIINTKGISDLMKNRLTEFCINLPSQTTYNINQKTFRFFKKVVKSLNTKMYFYHLLKSVKHNYYNITYNLNNVIGLHSGIPSPLSLKKQSKLKSTGPTQQQIQNYFVKVGTFSKKFFITVGDFISESLAQTAKLLNAKIKNALSFFETDSPLRNAVKSFVYAVGAAKFLDYLSPSQKTAIQTDAAAKEQAVDTDVGKTIDTAVTNLETTAGDIYAKTPELLEPEEFDLVAEELDIRKTEFIL